MKQPIKMPALSDTMETGRLLRWLKHPGDAVARGDTLAEVETDKAVMELEAFSSGSLIGPLAAEDKEYPVGETLAWLGDERPGQAGEGGQKAQEKPPERTPGETPAASVPEEAEAENVRQATPAPEAETPEAEAPEAEAPEAEAPEAEAPEAEAPEAETPEAEAPEARAPEARAPEAETPEARAPEVESAVPGGKARASAAAVAVSAVLEQALEGRAAPRVGERADVNAALLRELAAGPPYRIEPPRLLRRVVAATVSRALAAPQFRISTQVDLTGLKDYAARRKASFTLLIARACALTVREQPDFNAAWTADGLARRERVDVAIAMEAEHGLLSPVVRDVAGRSFVQLSEDWRALKENVERHRMAPEAYRGGTFYVSNLGMFPGIVQFDAIVPPGAAAILAVAAPGGQGTLLTLTCDHRVVFGADAARFLAALAERLARPEEWAE